MVKENLNVFAIFSVKDVNTYVEKGEFPDELKAAKIKY